MAPPVHQLDDQFDFMKTLYLDQRMKIQDIAQKLSERVRFPVPRRTLERRLKQWGLSRRDRTKDTPELRRAVSQTFYQKAARNDEEIYEDLKAQDFQVTKNGVAQLRRKVIGPLRLSKEDHPVTDAGARTMVESELQGDASEYGRGHMRVNLRQKGHNIARLYYIWQLFPLSYLYR
jgi:hypothetical protein